ncbi:MAG: portal protein [Pseudohongiellaceae bacterium]
MSTSSSVKNPGTAANQIPDQAITSSDNPDDRTAHDAKMKHRRDRFQTMQTFWSGIHADGLEDDKFVAGEHWPEQIKKERQEDRRPILTYNLMPSFTRQITNRVRQERPSLKVTPVETNRGADPRMGNMAGTADYSLADVYSGIIKNVEHVSRADQAYDTATKHAVDHGFGYFTLMPQWSKIDPFVQELVIRRVKNSYSVMMDPDAQEADYRDMQDAFIFSNMRKATFKAKYGDDAIAADFEGINLGADYQGWYDSDSVRIAQYMYLDWRDDEALMLSNGKVVYYKDVAKVLDDLERETGIHIAVDDSGKDIRKAVKRPICMWEKLTADEILEEVELPFGAVPVFPVLGEEVMVEGRTRYESAIRHAKDAQRSYNYWRTAAAETVALAPRAPWILTSKQLEGHEDQFESVNEQNLPYLEYNHQDGVPPPSRVFAAGPAAAELSNATQDGVDMQAIIGLHDASLGREGNEKSGKAIIARQNQGNTATFQFPDNLGRALEQCGRCLVEAIPKQYDTRRIIRIRLPDDSTDFVEINQSVKDGESGQEILVHDIAYGKYDVTLETGPSYATQRQEAADLQMELMKVLGPEVARNIMHLVVKNLGVPGSDEVAGILRKMLPEALKSEEEKMADLPKGVTKHPESGQLVDENGEPWQPEPTLEQQIAMKQQEIDELEHQAEIEKHQATKAKAQADLKEAELELAKLQQMAGGEANTGEMPAEQMNGMMDQIRQIIEETMQKHVDNPAAHAAMDIEGKLADAMVDVLKRVRNYVDKQVRDMPAPGAPATTTKDPESNGKGGGDTNITIKQGPDSLEISPGGDGKTIVKPVYNNGDDQE